MKKVIKRALSAVLTASMAVSLAACSNSGSEEFKPRLDTDKSVALDSMVFFSNFEALDQVINDFNEYYPNVTVSYEQVGGSSLKDCIENNPYIDIFMVSAENLNPNEESKYVVEYCADLSKENIDFSVINEEMLKARTYDEKLVCIPMSQNNYGMVVNRTLLEKEGLSVPNNYSEFVSVLNSLKEKGYTPIQAPNKKIYAELIENMVLDLIGTDTELQNALKNGDESAVSKLTPAFSIVEDFIKNGYIDSAVNESYPEDNYDEAILNFFEGNVPFWICNTEKVSGMKKRESKSEPFTANPFEYEFMYIPIGEKGAYVYTEPWYGFAANVGSDNYDYAVEFLRFLATDKEINQIADVKGVPSIAKDAENPIYSKIFNVPQTELSYVNDGLIETNMVSILYTVATEFGTTNEYTTAEDAARAFVQMCAEVQ